MIDVVDVLFVKLEFGCVWVESFDEMVGCWIGCVVWVVDIEMVNDLRIEYEIFSCEIYGYVIK